MAIVQHFEAHKTRSVFKTHPTVTTARYAVFTGDAGQKVLQIDSYGSDQRAKRDKQSQTLQFDEPTARVLWELLGQQFGFR